MRIHILSDLHQEFNEIDVPEVACDAVILAGDVSTKLNGLKWIRRRFPSVPVIYLCGNHEFYGDKLPSITDKLRLECRGTNIHFLENDVVELGATGSLAVRCGRTWPSKATGMREQPRLAES